MRGAIPVLSLTLALALAGCSKPAGATHQVTLANMAFGQPPADLRVGDAVEWINADIFQHSATARNGAFDVNLPPKAHVRTVMTRPGLIEVYCRYHPGMALALNVR